MLIRPSPLPHAASTSNPTPSSDDGQREPLQAAAQMHRDFVRLAVLEGVLQRFLNDSEQAQRQIGRQRRRNVLVREGDGDARTGTARVEEPCRAATRPISRSLAGCRRCDRSCTLFGNGVRAIQRFAGQLLGLASIGAARSSSRSIVSSAICWLMSSCSSRAIRERSVSCAFSSRAAEIADPLVARAQLRLASAHLLLGLSPSRPSARAARR